MNDIVQSSLNKSLVDKFRLIFTLPPALQRINRKFASDNLHIDRDTVQFSIYGTVIPEITVPAVEMRYAGSNLYNSSHSKDSFPPNDVKFDIDNQFNNYWVIWTWLNLLHDEKEGIFDTKNLTTDDTYLEYMSNIDIQSLDEYNKPIMQWTFVRSFPIKLGTISWDQRSEEQIPCSFSFVFSQIYAKRLNLQ